MNDKFLKPYDPQETEARIYAKWEKSGLFNPEKCIEMGYTKPDAKPFTIAMPPPNVTGVLHMGHALMLTTEDIMIRFERMRGRRTLYIPGTDHAAIATQARVEKEIYKKEGKSRYDLGREEMLNRIQAFIDEHKPIMREQMRVMGASCDWSREAYTLDEPRNLAVRTMFKKMYDDGLIYRGHRIVNWDPKGQTTISDDEIVYETRPAKIYTFRYSKDFPISISTTRPETKVGDVAVAVHPEDARYKKYIGKEYDADFCGVKIHIKIVADEAADPAFGTGAVGVTPAHSLTDAEIAARHNLPTIQVIDERAKMMVGGENIKGKKTTEAREVIIEWLKAEGLLEKEEEISQNISTAERTGGVIEPLPKLQWFVNVNKEFTIPHSEIKGIASGSKTTLKEIMLKSVQGGQIGIVPEHFEKTYSNWVGNLRDWCISRQIWFGHRIPVWYRGEEIFCGTEVPEGDGWRQDEDTLDTWFSSGMWTFSVLGWPEKTEDLKIYHPTTILETGYEIIFFWVARMVLMSGYALGTIPFQTVFFHGTVRDGQGRKMSKSLGNGMDPLDVAKKFGTDAGRMALIVGTAPGTDSKISEDKIKGYKNFGNKLWNITRFILSNSPEKINDSDVALTEKDRELLAEFDALLKDVTSDMENFRYHLASEKLYHYVWHRFADVILEESKPVLPDYKTGEIKDATACLSRQTTLINILLGSLKALHPFMPFVTEEIWSLLPGHTEKDILMVAPWPMVQ